MGWDQGDTLSWTDHDGANCWVTADPEALEDTGFLAIIDVKSAPNSGTGVYVDEVDARHLIAFLQARLKAL